MRASPIDDVAQSVAAAEGRPYRTAAIQRSAIMARLMRGPASVHELHALGVPSVTKRISELRRMGFAIVGGWAPMSGPGGTVSLCMVYALAEPDDRQRDLFAEGAA